MGTPKTHFANFIILLSGSSAYLQKTKQMLCTRVFLSIQQNTAIQYETYHYMIYEMFLTNHFIIKKSHYLNYHCINHFIPISHFLIDFTLLKMDSQVPMTACEPNLVYHIYFHSSVTLYNYNYPFCLKLNTHRIPSSTAKPVSSSIRWE